MDTINNQLLSIVQNQPYPLLFATVSGSHLYGFPSADSDYDLRGVHILPLPDVIGLVEGEETVECSQIQNDLQLDLVTHDIKKFFGLLLKKNGYVLEQLYSPLVVYATPEHEELKQIAQGCITRFHAHHYQGFAQTQWRLFQKEHPPQVKPLLYVYRVLLTGIYLMQTGEVQANLVTLNQHFQLTQIPDLIACKLAGAEKSALTDSDLAFHQQEYQRLSQVLEEASNNSHLPDTSSAKDTLHQLLVRVRLAQCYIEPPQR
ncbi:nucleotidyltransferase domain-containing protein [Phormidium sp. LEGE 05292]|uniref:nucleotidyltransferase domain-containing protein n=1 Tax=[Phormidium] sp. LEGE 05292 TaxID=767427 RepID=UPI00187EC3E4|nr:nucleotidyltransferase domain-containing protein [Phormidium sp. LEGE 05292]MBE9226330.1 nucleotidyltransferase domain-containing protein [Phormidium sp. LEGE 05292]